jgi:hypothetical protein
LRGNNNQGGKRLTLSICLYESTVLASRMASQRQVNHGQKLEAYQ